MDHGLVELDRTGDGGTVGGLLVGGDDPGGREHQQPGLRAHPLAGVPADGADYIPAHHHQQHADEVDRDLQLVGVDLQHYCAGDCHHHDPGRHE